MNFFVNRLIPTLSSVVVLLSLTSCSSQSVSSQTVTPVSDIRQVTVVDGLEHPWGMVWLPDGTILITERPGRLRIVRDGVLDPTPISGTPEVFNFKQGGLLDISLHPRFQENRYIYFTHSDGTSEANRTQVIRGKLDGKTLQEVETIFQVSQTKPDGQHFGSRMVWLPDNTLLVSIGDGGNPPVELEGDLIRQQAQNLNSHLGKIIRLNDDGSIPTDNPFVGSENAKPAVWSYGHRNIQGMTLNPTNNQVWATEHGAKGGDELNQVDVGGNYGWPVVTYSREYFGPAISDETSRPGMVDPKVVWTPAIAPSGLVFYNGDRFAAWRGDLFAGGLVSQDVRYIDLDSSGNVLNQQSIDIGQRVRDVKVGPDGLIYILTDEDNGQLIRLEPPS
jgi:glucose/arabinose dehydrogenase